MKFIIKIIIRYIKSFILKRKGISISPYSHFNNKTICEGCNVIHAGANISSSYIGYGTYIGPNSLLSNARIGRYCSIAGNVKIISATHPTKDFVSTSPMFFSTLKQSGKTYVNSNCFNEFLSIEGRTIIVGNDVWIGEGVTIKGGVTIGDGAVLAMNACVTRDVPPYAIVGGVPAKIIRYRFDNNIIQGLLSIRWWDKPEDWIIKHAPEFCDITKFINNFRNENSTYNNCSSL